MAFCVCDCVTCHLQVGDLLRILWDSLLDLDDLSASTTSILQLLSILLVVNPAEPLLAPCDAAASAKDETTPVQCSANEATAIPEKGGEDPANTATDDETVDGSVAQASTHEDPSKKDAGTCPDLTPDPPSDGAVSTKKSDEKSDGSGASFSATLSVPLSFSSLMDGADLAALVPRLWPFLSHRISSVRQSCLKALCILLKVGSSQLSQVGSSAGGEPVAMETEDGVIVSGVSRADKSVWPVWLGAILQSVLCQVFQRFALESEEDNRTLLHEVCCVHCIKWFLLALCICMCVRPCKILAENCRLHTLSGYFLVIF